MKRILALALVLTLIFSLAVVAEASGGEVTQSTVIADFNNDGQIEVGTVDDVEVNEASEHLDAAEASASGKCQKGDPNQYLRSFIH